MSMSVQSGGVWGGYGSGKEDPNDEFLRLELSWKTVSAALTQVLISYAMLVLCVLLSVGLAFYLMGRMPEGVMPSDQKQLEIAWVYHGGSGLIFLLYLFSYIKLLINKWRCAIHSPDRNGSKWFIFACCLCMIIGPIIGIAGAISINLYGGDVNPTDIQALENLNKVDNLEDLDAVQESSPLISGIMQTAVITYIAGVAISLATLVCFVLFLRAIGSCFKDGTLIYMADIFILFSVALICFTVYLLFLADFQSAPPIFVIALPIAWLGTGVWYIVLIILARYVINHRMDGLQSPLDVTG